MSLIKNRYRTHTEWHTDLFSTTFNAMNETDGRKLLITKIHDKWLSRPVVENLLQACRRLSAVRHSGLASILDFHFDGQHFFVVYDVPETASPMEVVIRAERGWPPEKHHKIIHRILEGLITLETRGLSHGHLNFMTIWMVDEQPLLVHAQLYDILFCANTNQLSKYKNGIFLAPEQRHGQPGSPLSDMFSVGVMLYILLSHRWPVPYSPSLDTLLKAYQTGIEPFQPIAATPLLMYRLLNTALAIPPTNRFKTLEECQHALSVATQEKKDVPPPPTTPVRTIEKAKEPVTPPINKRLVIGFPLLVLLVIILLYFVYSLYMTSVPIKVIPNIEGLSVSEATEKLEALGLRVHVSGSRVSKEVRPGYVLESRPAPGREVKQNRLILLFIAKALDELQVPDFQGRSWTQSLALASEIGIQVLTIDEQYSATVDASYVIHQDTTPNATVSPNISVGVVLSKGYPVSVSITPSPVGEALRRVSVSLEVPSHWPAQTLTVQHLQDTQSRTLFSKLGQPSFENTMVYDLPLGSSIQVMYNNRIAGKYDILDSLDAAHSTANASSL
jgi:serine/threonine protein kinase